MSVLAHDGGGETAGGIVESVIENETRRLFS